MKVGRLPKLGEQRQQREAMGLLKKAGTKHNCKCLDAGTWARQGEGRVERQWDLWAQHKEDGGT